MCLKFGHFNNLRIEFNRESAHWAKVKKEAESAYQRWINPILTKMSAEADHELFDIVFDQVGLRDSINKKNREMHEMHAIYTGSGNKGIGLGTSTSTMGSTPFQNSNQFQ